MRLKALAPVLYVCAVFAFAMGCSSPASAPEAGPDIASVTLSPSDKPLVSMGQVVQLSAVVTDTDGNIVLNPDLNWSSSDDGVLTVESNGLMQGESGGTATVSASVGGKTGSLTIRIVDLTGTWTGGEDPDMVTYTLSQTETSAPGTFSSLLGFPPITNVNTGVLAGSLSFDRYEHTLTVITEADCEMVIRGVYRVQVEGSGDLTLVGIGSAPITSPNCSLGGSINLATLRRE